MKRYFLLASLLVASGAAVAETDYEISNGNVTVTHTETKSAAQQYDDLQKEKAIYEQAKTEAQAKLDLVNAKIQKMLDAGYEP